MDLVEQKNILEVFRQLIEMSQRRGCWMANEMEHIGATYNRIEMISKGIEKYEEEEMNKKMAADKGKEKTSKPKSVKRKEPVKE